MGTGYLSSATIKMFPSANRDATSDSNAKLTTEYNLVNIVNRLVNQKSFVISNSYDSGSPFEFNINGYYFKANTGASIISAVETSNPSNVYAHIKMDTSYDEIKRYNDPSSNSSTNTDVATYLLDETDEGGSTKMFKGVYFSNSTDSSATYSLHILTKSNDTYVIPPKSKVKFILDDGNL